jgi:septal ring factor EnvC (AmiA/AmiB activator)
MYSLVLNGKPLSVSIIPLVAKCGLFQTKPELLGKPYKVESSVSMDSLRAFAGAIGGEAAEISGTNVRDLSQLCDEFKFVELAKTVGDWQAEHPQIDPVIRREPDLVRAALEERLESQARTMVMLDQAVHRGWETTMSDAEKLSAMEAEVSGLRVLLGETAASVQKAARDIDQVKAAAAEQRMAHGRDICALEEEIGRVGKATEATGRLLGQQEGEWKAAIGDLHKKAKQGGSEVSGLKEVLGNLESKQETLRETVAKQGTDLAETRRRNSELGGRVEQLEEENQQLRESSEGLKGQLARVEAG